MVNHDANVDDGDVNDDNGNDNGDEQKGGGVGGRKEEARCSSLMSSLQSNTDYHHPHR